MNETVDYRITLLTGGLTHWGEALTPLLLAQTEYLVVAETVDELLSIPLSERPEMIFICHEPGNYDGITAAELIRTQHMVTPLVLLADENMDTMKAALAVGALAVMALPVSDKAFHTVFNNCCHLAQALRWETLKQQHGRNMAELFMHSPCCQMFIDTDGHVTSFNNAAARITGVAPHGVPEFDQLSGRFFAPHALTYPLELEEAVHSGKAWSGILAGRLPDAGTRLYLIVSMPLTHAEKSSGVLLTLHDVTEAEADHARLRVEMQAARDCLALVGSAETNRYLLQLSGQLPLAQEVFSLAALLESVRSSGGRPGSETEIAIPDYLPAYFRGDANRLGFMLKAVLAGSAAFGQCTPQISLSVKQRAPSSMSVQFTVRVKNSAVISEGFHTAADYLNAAGETLHASDGLGLAALLCEQMNGRLIVRSERNGCRAISCVVPLQPDEKYDIPLQPAGTGLDLDAASLPPVSHKVLVAEDNQIQQTTLKHLLEDIGCQAILVGNGREAVEEFENGDFDLILMDILMPVMDGFEATRLIRERERITGGRIPVVAMTSYSLKAIQDKCLSVGMSGYLAKPVVKNRLVEALQRLSQPQEAGEEPDETMPPDLTGFPVLEARSVLENLGYNLELYRELVAMYLTDSASYCDELTAELVGNDLKETLKCAHSLKGMVSSIGGERLAEVARQIQSICLGEKRSNFAPFISLVKSQSAELRYALEHIDWEALSRFVASKS